MKNIAEIDKNFQSATIDKTDMKTYDVRNEPFTLYGLYKPESDNLFRRVPDAVAKEMSDGAYALHTNTAGVRVRFKTDSQYIAIKAKIPWPSLMPIMAISGSCGFDMYADGDYVATYKPPTVYEDRFRATFDISEGFEDIFTFRERKMRDIIINFPLYSNVSDVLIGIQEDAKLEKGNEYTYKTPVVFYGSSITQGGSASRPGNSYQAIISRVLDCDYINLGFSGNARAEKAITDYIAQLKMSVFVYDYDHNAPTPQFLKETHKPMFDAIRSANPELPIIMVSRPNDPNNDAKERFEIIKETYDAAIASGDKNVYIINGIDILNLYDKNIMTVDGCHPTDFGFFCMAQVIGEAVKKVLK